MCSNQYVHQQSANPKTNKKVATGGQIKLMSINDIDISMQILEMK